MTFTEPYGLSLLAFVPLFLALMSLFLRRRNRKIPSYHLIREVIDSLPLLPKSFLLRKRIQLFLFLAAVLLFALAAAGPLIGPPEAKPYRAVVVLDHLAHWKGPGGADGPWDAVLEEARSLVGKFRRDDRILLVRTDGGALPEGFTSPRRAKALLGKLSPSEDPLSPGDTVDYLHLIEEGHRPDLVALVTPLPSRWRDALAEKPPTWRIIASPPPPTGPNYGIVDVDVRPNLLQPGTYDLYCRVGLFDSTGTSEGGEVSLSVKWNDEPLAVESLTLRPGEPKGVVLPGLNAGDGLLSVTLEPEDGFPGDNRYFTPIRSRPFLKTGLVSMGNHALESALRSIPGLSLSLSEPGESLPGRDITVRVYDAVVPARWGGNALMIRPTQSMPELTISGEATGPETINADESHPLLEGVSFGGLSMKRLPLFLPGPTLRILATVDGYPFLLAGEARGGGRLAVLGFDPVESGWMYDPSFPILIANLVSWLSMESTGSSSSFLVGDSLAVDILEGTKEIRGPAGETYHPSGGEWGGFTFPLAGRYRVVAEERGRSGEVFVNLLNEEVSRSMAPGGAGEGDGPPPFLAGRPFRLDMRGLLLVAGILLLLLESLAAPSARVGRLS